MDSLGYIRDVEGVAQSLGGRVLGKTTIRNVANPLNPTVCFVIEPPPAQVRVHLATDDPFSVPGTDHPLSRVDDFYWSPDTGLCFPVLRGLPLLKSKVAILASAFCGHGAESTPSFLSRQLGDDPAGSASTVAETR